MKLKLKISSACRYSGEAKELICGSSDKAFTNSTWQIEYDRCGGTNLASEWINK